MHKTSKLPGRKGRKWIVFSLECYEGLCTDDELCACLLCFFEVGLRDKEVERLNRALQGGRPQDVISLEAQNVSHEKMIANLNLQACATVSIWSTWPESLRPHPLVCGCLLYQLLLCLLQLEYLQETNRTLEEKVQGLQQKKKHVSTEVANLSLKNLELCEELTHIDHLAKQMEIDKDRVLETADMELQDAKVRREDGKH